MPPPLTPPPLPSLVLKRFFPFFPFNVILESKAKSKKAQQPHLFIQRLGVFSKLPRETL